MVSSQFFFAELEAYVFYKVTMIKAKRHSPAGFYCTKSTMETEQCVKYTQR